MGASIVRVLAVFDLFGDVSLSKESESLVIFVVGSGGKELSLDRWPSLVSVASGCGNGDVAGGYVAFVAEVNCSMVVRIAHRS